MLVDDAGDEGHPIINLHLQLATSLSSIVNQASDRQN